MIYVITRKDCPYCAAARENIARCIDENEELRMLEIYWLTETEEILQRYDYFYVPAIFWDKEKLAEGEYSVDAIRDVLRKAYRKQSGLTE